MAPPPEVLEDPADRIEQAEREDSSPDVSVYSMDRGEEEEEVAAEEEENDFRRGEEVETACLIA